MYYFTINVTIEGFDKFKPVFDSDEERRRSLGVNTLAIMKSIENENNITIVMSAPDLITIEDRKNDSIIREKMMLSGVKSIPEWKIYKA